ncbi:MAG TPA: phytanoyl-CoA dioxygenase family protein [Acidimicrobiales bacterium]|nr:phytanoyl-CoA dioxygenase family protein [Acidimicrobiales bacterium]
MSVDVRTRVDGEQAPLDPDRFFGVDLPAALDAAAPLLAEAVATLRLPDLVVVVGGVPWTLSAAEAGIEVRPGAPDGDDGLRLRVDAGQLSDLVDDQVTPMGWFSSGALDLDGRLERLLDWWLVLRGALDGVAPRVAQDMAFEDSEGRPLDLTRRFGWDDADEEMDRFLGQAGYLHVGSVFTEEEMAAVWRDMDRVAPSYVQGDGRSWWARTSDGADRLVRMQGFDAMSPHAAALVADGRLARLGALTGDGHQWGQMDSNALEALVKPIGVVEGISDVPWHKDCSLGRHSYECCGLTVGISVTGADRTSGQLRVVAGSHRALVWPAFLRRDNALPVVDLPTQTGDVTVHLSCTLHMAQPPVDRERRVMYTGFRLPPLRPDADTGADSEARRRLRAVRETAATTVSQPPSSVRG